MVEFGPEYNFLTDMKCYFLGSAYVKNDDRFHFHEEKLLFNFIEICSKGSNLQ